MIGHSVQPGLLSLLNYFSVSYFFLVISIKQSKNEFPSETRKSLSLAAQAQLS